VLRDAAQPTADPFEAFAEALATMTRDQDQVFRRIKKGELFRQFSLQREVAIEARADRMQRVDNGVAGHYDRFAGDVFP
jgi:hypothetical protein